MQAKECQCRICGLKTEDELVLASLGFDARNLTESNKAILNATRTKKVDFDFALSLAQIQNKHLQWDKDNITAAQVRDDFGASQDFATDMFATFNKEYLSGGQLSQNLQFLMKYSFAKAADFASVKAHTTGEVPKSAQTAEDLSSNASSLKTTTAPSKDNSASNKNPEPTMDGKEEPKTSSVSAIVDSVSASTPEQLALQDSISEEFASSEDASRQTPAATQSDQAPKKKSMVFDLTAASANTILPPPPAGFKVPPLNKNPQLPNLSDGQDLDEDDDDEGIAFSKSHAKVRSKIVEQFRAPPDDDALERKYAPSQTLVCDHCRSHGLPCDEAAVCVQCILHEVPCTHRRCTKSSSVRFCPDPNCHYVHDDYTPTFRDDRLHHEELPRPKQSDYIVLEGKLRGYKSEGAKSRLIDAVMDGEDWERVCAANISARQKEARLEMAALVRSGKATWKTVCMGCECFHA